LPNLVPTIAAKPSARLICNTAAKYIHPLCATTANTPTANAKKTSPHVGRCTLWIALKTLKYDESATTTTNAPLSSTISLRVKKSGQKATNDPTDIWINLRVYSGLISCRRHNNSETTIRPRTPKVIKASVIISLYCTQQNVSGSE